MWSLGVGIDPPVFDDLSRLGEVAEDVFVQAFISQSAIESFHECVLHWLAWRDVMPTNAHVLASPQHRMGCRFGSVVADNHVRLATPVDQLIQFTAHAGTRQGTIHDGCWRLARTIIDDAQHAEPLAILKGVRHDVERPTLIGAIRHRDGPSRQPRIL